MSEEEIDRKIAVIFATDVVGYSKHMEADESGTVKNLRACEKILTGLFEKHKGRLFNTGGDSFLAEFPSAVSAVECAVEFQKAIKERNSSEEASVKLQFRIGINSGDVIKEKDNLLGDGVNIAARLEALAQSGGITISKVIYDFVKGKTQYEFNDLGLQKVKQNEFYAYDLLMDGDQRRKIKEKSNSIMVAAASIVVVFVAAFLGYTFLNEPKIVISDHKQTIISDKPTILIKNFENITGSAENDYLGVGITTNIIATLNKSERFEVPPSSTAKYLEEVSLANTELKGQYGIEFLVTGSIQGNSDKLRVTAEMIDVVENTVIWSEIYDFKKANDIFNILEKFAGYGFNKSHSAAYGIISYQTAYLKANHPVDFMAGVLACELGNSDKLAHFIGECAEMGISVLGPDVNESGENFTPVESFKILFRK